MVRKCFRIDIVITAQSPKEGGTRVNHPGLGAIASQWNQLHVWPCKAREQSKSQLDKGHLGDGFEFQNLRGAVRSVMSKGYHRVGMPVCGPTESRVRAESVVPINPSKGTAEKSEKARREADC